MDSGAVAQDVLESDASLQNNGQNNKPASFAVCALQLTCFRSYSTLNVELTDEPVVLIGPNGAGKTNILEAISFLSPGRGFRNAKLIDIDHRSNEVSVVMRPWAVATQLQTPQGKYAIGTGRDPVSAGVRSAKRVIKVDGELVRGQAELAKIFSVVWLTPQMDQLFISSGSDRRKFLDRIVYHFDASHAKRVSDYEQNMRERAKLLQTGQTDPYWFSTLEQNMATLAISIAVARMEAVQRLQQAILQSTTPFPKAYIRVEGVVESWLENMSAVEAEERLLLALADKRGLDRASGRTTIGTHRSDMLVVQAEKNMPAALCSTGEQKALLLSIVLAEVRARAIWRGSVPVLLLDEVVAHLDAERRAALFAEITDLKAQAWMTGTDQVLFEGFGQNAQYREIKDGEIRPVFL